MLNNTLAPDNSVELATNNNQDKIEKLLDICLRNLMKKHFMVDGNEFSAGYDSGEAYKEATGVEYPGESYATHEEKISFLLFLTSL